MSTIWRETGLRGHRVTAHLYLSFSVRQGCVMSHMISYYCVTRHLSLCWLCCCIALYYYGLCTSYCSLLLFNILTYWCLDDIQRSNYFPHPHPNVPLCTMSRFTWYCCCTTSCYTHVVSHVTCHNGRCVIQLDILLLK